jgi:uncharacterized OsmC-like protein
MHQIVIEYEGALRTRATHLQSGNEIITDAPVDNHGKGEAFSPTDLVVASLGSCMLTIMGIAGERRGLDLSGTRTEVEKVMGTNPRRISGIHLNIYFKTNFSDTEKKILEKAAYSCPVHQSLHPDTNKIITFHYPKI